MPEPTTGLRADDVLAHAWCAPDDAPASYRGPHALSTRGWEDFARRLDRREELAAIRSLVSGHEHVLDVGGGTGQLVRAAADQVGRATTVEPHQDRVAVLRADPTTDGRGVIDVHPGRAESLPFADGSFDAVYAAWVLPYVDDLEAALREIARVSTRTREDAVVAVIVGAPDNELVTLLNAVCVPIADERPDHQGFLLATAARVLAEHGIDRFDLRRTEAALHFPEVDLAARIDAASDVLAGFWYGNHPAVDEMRSALCVPLGRHFRRRPHAIGDQGIVLIGHRSG